MLLLIGKPVTTMMIDKLNNNSNNEQQLQMFIEQHSIEIYDSLIVESHKRLVNERQAFERFILSKYSLFQALDYLNQKNKSFLYALLSVSERLGMQSQFEQLYFLAKRKNVELTDRLEAASVFLMNVIEVNDYSDRIDKVLSLLVSSYEDQDDSLNEVLATLLHFYLEVYRNFADYNYQAVYNFSNLLLSSLNQEKYEFLNTSEVQSLLKASFLDYNSGYNRIVNVLDNYLNIKFSSEDFNHADFSVEAGTEYAKALEDIDANCSSLCDLVCELYSDIKDDKIYRSLERGVKVLTSEEQLLAYIYSYGRMHFAKLHSALQCIDKFNSSSIEVIDWGCGQGLATISLLEDIKNRSQYLAVSSVILIEPSEIALKRAALHTRKFDQRTRIRTVNKDLDSVIKEELANETQSLKIHLFSNILDIDLFSMSKLIDNIKSVFKGDNIFICVSPYINEYKTQRIDDFVEEFKSYPSFEIIEEQNQKAGEWKNKWTRVVRVFSVTIN